VKGLVTKMLIIASLTQILSRPKVQLQNLPQAPLSLDNCLNWFMLLITAPMHSDLSHYNCVKRIVTMMMIVMLVSIVLKEMVSKQSLDVRVRQNQNQAKITVQQLLPQVPPAYQQVAQHLSLLTFQHLSLLTSWNPQ